MFTIIALSNKADHYTFKIKVNKQDKDILIELLDNIKKINKLMMEKSDDLYIDQNIFRGELIGLDYTSSKDISKEYMIKELNKWKSFFMINSFDVYDVKIVNLKTRLSTLEKQNCEIKELINELI